MGASRLVCVLTLILTAGLMLAAVPVRAETPLIEILKVNPEWVGTVDASKRLAVTFDVSGDPATLKNISYRWETESRRYVVEFKLDDRNVKFLIPPGDRNRWYELELTGDEQLVGTLTGLSRDRQRNFEEFVLLRPVGNAEARVEAETTRALTLMGSAKHCNVPSDFQISDGDGLSATQKRFLGFFSGYWDEKLQHTLLVADITKNGTASVYYAFETYANWDIDDPGCTRFKAKIDDGKLTGTLGNGAKVKYRFSDPDTLEGEYDRKNRITPGTFKRQEVLLRPVGNAEARVEAETTRVAEAAGTYDGEWSGYFDCVEPDWDRYTFFPTATVRGNEMTLIVYFTGRHIRGGRTDEVREKQTGTIDDSGHTRLRGIGYSTRNRKSTFTSLEGRFEGEIFDGKSTRWNDECTVMLNRTYSPFEEEKRKAEQARKAEAARTAKIARLKHEAEQARKAEAAHNAREAEAEKLRAAEIAKLKQEVEKQRKTGSQLTEGGSRELKTRMAEIARLRKEAEQRQKAEKARKAREADVKKARAAEMARMKREIEKARQAEAARKAREAEAEKLRAAEMARMKREIEKARKGHATEIARLKQEAERAEKARDAEIAHLRKALKERADRTGVKNALSDLSGVEFGRYHALVIGINDYKYLPKLKTAVNDARAVAQVLGEEYRFRVRTLINPDDDELIDALDEYRETLGPKDNLLIYYAGHGWLDEEVDQGYWLPVNAKPKRRSNWVSNATITDTLKGLAAKHVIVVADSCYSGTLVRGADMGPRTRTGDYWKQLAAKWARVAITSGGLEPVADKGGGNHSPFAKAFIDALKDNNTVMDGTQLFSKIRRPVMIAANQTPQYSDVRQAGHDGGDFIFVRKR